MDVAAKINLKGHKAPAKTESREDVVFGDLTAGQPTHGDVQKATTWLESNIHKSLQSGPFAVLGTLSPALATVLLSAKRNPSNRSVSERSVSLSLSLSLSPGPSY